VAILEGLPREHGNEFVFIGRSAGNGLSNMAMLECLKGVSGNGLTVHGFRSTFKDWAAEATGFPNIVPEQALAHALKDKVEAAYRRGDLFAKRAKLMTAWAEYCARAGAEVVQIRRRA
jgi:integrase